MIFWCLWCASTRVLPAAALIGSVKKQSGPDREDRGRGWIGCLESDQTVCSPTRQRRNATTLPPARTSCLIFFSGSLMKGCRATRRLRRTCGVALDHLLGDLAVLAASIACSMARRLSRLDDGGGDLVGAHALGLDGRRRDVHRDVMSSDSGNWPWTSTPEFAVVVDIGAVDRACAAVEGVGAGEGDVLAGADAQVVDLLGGLGADADLARALAGGLGRDRLDGLVEVLVARGEVGLGASSTIAAFVPLTTTPMRPSPAARSVRCPSCP